MRGGLILGATAWLCLGTACEDDLSIGGVDVSEGGGVVVRLRPVCGNGRVEAGEDCDDGRNGDDRDGCSDACQTPCPGGALAVVACGSGRTFTEEGTVTNMAGERIAYAIEHRTSVCTTEDGRGVELVTCTQGVCLNAVAPSAGRHVCHPPCDDSTPCAEASVCVRLYRTPFRSLGQPLEGVCVPIIGGRVGDRCGSTLQCGGGGGCGVVDGTADYLVCTPPPRGDTCGQGTCPGDYVCGNAFDVLTGDPLGIGCFASRRFPTGTELPDGVNSGCVGGWSTRTSNAPGARRYCTQPCGGSGQCPVGFSCRASDPPLCFVDDPSSLRRAPPFDPVPGHAPAPGCADDTSPACTFGSACDPDCERRTGCGLASAGGRCQGDVLTYCEEDRVVEVDCERRDLRCGFDPEQARFDCIRED